MRITFTYKTITNVGLKLLGEMGILFWIMFLYCCLFVMLAVGSRGDIGVFKIFTCIQHFNLFY